MTMLASAPETIDSTSNALHAELRPRQFANVLGVGIDALNMQLALDRLASFLDNNRTGYVCAIDVHGVLEANLDPCIADVFAGALLALPDGAPTVWTGRLQGHKHMDHVTGPDLMFEIFRQNRFSSYTHFLYGGKPGVAEELAAVLGKQFPSSRVVGTYTPPFRDLTLEEEDNFIATVDDLRPDFIWVGIGSPRQDMFMRRMMPCLKTRLMIGVGAAFDFHTGRLRNCPPWVKRAGLQWLHRFVQDPKRLWRRNLRNMAFLWHIAMQITGLKTCDLPPQLMRGQNAGPRPRRARDCGHEETKPPLFRQSADADPACSAD